MIRTRELAVTLAAALASCSGCGEHTPPAASKAAAAQEATRVERVHEYSLEGSAGVMALTDRYTRNDFVQIYNEDGSLWYRFTFYDTEPAAPANANFKPFSFSRDYFVLALKLVGKSEGRYEVVVNEETGLRKYVRADDPVLKFQTWEEHILQVSAVDFNRDDNPLLDKPAGGAKLPHPSKGATFRPVAVNGEWLQVRWSDPGKKEGRNVKEDTGWIRWKNGGDIAVELIYFS